MRACVRACVRACRGGGGGLHRLQDFPAPPTNTVILPHPQTPRTCSTFGTFSLQRGIAPSTNGTTKKLPACATCMESTAIHPMRCSTTTSTRTHSNTACTVLRLPPLPCQSCTSFLHSCIFPATHQLYNCNMLPTCGFWAWYRRNCGRTSAAASPSCSCVLGLMSRPATLTVHSFQQVQAGREVRCERRPPTFGG